MTGAGPGPLAQLAGTEPAVRWDWLVDHRGALVTGVAQHLRLTAIAVGVGFALSLALAVVALRFRVTLAPITAATGILYAIPSLALFVLLTPITGLTTLTAEIALVSYTLQILVRSIVAGVAGVPPAVREAAEGLGHGRLQLLGRVELPLALPVIASGVRIATVTTVGLVPISGILGSDQGGLGQLIFDGLNRNFPTPLLAGAVLTVALAVGLDVSLLGVERALTPWVRRPGGSVGTEPWLRPARRSVRRPVGGAA
jgi:osmoprotectant transport system permease protein